MPVHMLVRRGYELKDLAISVKEVFRLKSDEMFAERIAEKIVEMVKKGYKVYVTGRAARILEPLLERYGIVLVPVRRIEYPHILIDIPNENIVFIRFKDQELRKNEREIMLETFLKYLEKALKKYLGEEENKKEYIIEVAKRS